MGMRISWSDRMSNRRHVASSEPVANAKPFGKYCNEQMKDDWLGFSGTFGAKRLYCVYRNMNSHGCLVLVMCVTLGKTSFVGKCLHSCSCSFILKQFFSECCQARSQDCKYGGQLHCLRADMFRVLLYTAIACYNVNCFSYRVY